MIYKKNEVFMALSDVCKNVCVAFPQAMEILPCICYHELENKPLLVADDVEYLSSIVYAIDVFTDKQEPTRILVEGVEAAMHKLGFVRQFCSDTQQKDLQKNQVSMRFEWIG